MTDENPPKEESDPVEANETGGREKALPGSVETAELKAGVRGGGKGNGWGIGIVTGIIIAFVPALLVAYCSAREFQKPDVEVDGVLPVLVHGERSGPPVSEDGEPTQWPTYELVFIFKLHNNGPSAARVGVVQVAGCASLPSDIAGAIFRQEVDGRSFHEIYEEAENKWGGARQKIVTTGSPPTVDEVGAFATIYVPIKLSMPIQFVWHTSEHLQSTVAVEGDCSGVETNYDPSAYQIFEAKRLKGHLAPVSLREEFLTGDLRVEVQVGNELLRVEPSAMKPLKRIAARFWPDVQVGELYENPGSMYLPRDRD